MSTRPAPADRADIVAKLREGLSDSRIARELRADKARVRRVRKEIDLPPFVPAEQTRTVEDKWRQFARPTYGGHMEWTGERAGPARSPVMRYKEKSVSPAAVAFELHTGRPARGQVIADCGRTHCVAPGHVQDEPGRQAKRLQDRRDAGLGDLPETCRYGHQQDEHGRLDRSGIPYCEQCKRERKADPDPQLGIRLMTHRDVRHRIAKQLRAGEPEIRIARRLGVAPATVRRTRQALGLPDPPLGSPEQYASPEDVLRAHAEPSDDGHVRWIGPAYSKRGAPYVLFRGRRIVAGRVAFEAHHGRPPVGYVRSSCGTDGCLAGSHLTDRPMREANERADAAFTAIFGDVT